MADEDISSAAEFAKWGREREPENQYICQVFVRDFEVFRQMNKVKITLACAILTSLHSVSGLDPGAWLSSKDTHRPRR